jgi:hypothetical protein
MTPSAMAPSPVKFPTSTNMRFVPYARVFNQSLSCPRFSQMGARTPPFGRSTRRSCSGAPSFPHKAVPKLVFSFVPGCLLNRRGPAAVNPLQAKDLWNSPRNAPGPPPSPLPPNCPSRGILDGGSGSSQRIQRHLLLSSRRQDRPFASYSSACFASVRALPPHPKGPFQAPFDLGRPAHSHLSVFRDKGPHPRLLWSTCEPLPALDPLLSPAKGTARCAFWGVRGVQRGGPKNGPLSPLCPHRGPRPESNVDRLLYIFHDSFLVTLPRHANYLILSIISRRNVP